MIDVSQFSTKKDLFNYLAKNKTKILNMKKSAIKYSDSVGNFSTIKKKDEVSKGHENSTSTDLVKTIVANTYNWMDSHDDVHLKGTFTKSISERANKVFHLHDHKYQIDAIVGEPLKIYEQDIAWKSLGVEKLGTTQSLMMESKIIKDNKPNIFNAYKNGKINQHSVGMKYVLIDLAINDETKKEEFKLYNDNIDKIANKERAEEQGFFYLVKEAKLIEISAVLMGSNELTPTLEDKSEAAKALQDEAAQSLQDEADKALQDKEAAKALQELTNFINKIQF